MAVGFFAPEDDERPNGVYHQHVVTTTHSATQTPLQSPVSREFLVQAFCEALERCAITGEYRIFLIRFISIQFVYFCFVLCDFWLVKLIFRRSLCIQFSVPTVRFSSFCDFSLFSRHFSLPSRVSLARLPTTAFNQWKNTWHR